MKTDIILNVWGEILPVMNHYSRSPHTDFHWNVRLGSMMTLGEYLHDGSMMTLGAYFRKARGICMRATAHDDDLVGPSIKIPAHEKTKFTGELMRITAHSNDMNNLRFEGQKVLDTFLMRVATFGY